MKHIANLKITVDTGASAPAKFEISGTPQPEDPKEQISIDDYPALVIAVNLLQDMLGKIAAAPDPETPTPWLGENEMFRRRIQDDVKIRQAAVCAMRQLIKETKQILNALKNGCTISHQNRHPISWLHKNLVKISDALESIDQ